MPVLFRRGWNTVPAASHPVAQGVGVVENLHLELSWQNHHRHFDLGWRGRLQKRAQHLLVIFRFRVWL